MQRTYIHSIFIYILLGILLSLNSGCTERSRITESLEPDFFSLKINPDEGQKLNMSNLISTVSWTQLETSKESLLGRVDRFRASKDKYYFMDLFSTNTLSVFDHRGDFLFKLENTGNGPGEFGFMHDFTFDQKHLYILDQGKRVLQYNLEGTYEKLSLLPGFTLDYLEKTSFGFAGIGAEGMNNLILMDKNFQFTAGFFPYINRNVDALLINPLNQLSPTDTYYRRYLTDTLFSLSETGIKPRLYLDFGKYQIDRSKITENKSLEGFARMLEPYCVVKTFYETQTHALIRFHYEKNEYWTIFDKINQRHLTIDKSRLINDLMVDARAYPCGIDPDSDSFVFMVQPYNVKETLKNRSVLNGSQKDTNSIIGFVDSISEDDNPILCKVQFKSL